MKFFVFVITLFVAITAIAGLKSSECGLPKSLNGDGRMACFGFVPSWSYDQANNQCESFVYGGCGGNKNRFPTKEQCEETCKE